MRFSEKIETILKGGQGSGVKGHRTFKESLKYNIKEMKTQSSKEIVDGVEKVLSRSPGASKIIEQWLEQSDQGKLENLVGEAFNIETKSVRNPSGKIAAMEMKYGHDSRDVMAMFDIYHASQELLRRKHPDGRISLLRGQTKGSLKDGKTESYSLSSWTDVQDIAEDFANTQANAEVVKKEFPIKHILIAPEISDRLSRKLYIRGESEFVVMSEGSMTGVEKVT